MPEIASPNSNTNRDGTSNAIRSIETTGVHHAARRRDGLVAARGACAAGPPARVVGLLHQGSPGAFVSHLDAFRQGLKESDGGMMGGGFRGGMGGGSWFSLDLSLGSLLIHTSTFWSGLLELAGHVR